MHGRRCTIATTDRQQFATLGNKAVVVMGGLHSCASSKLTISPRFIRSRAKEILPFSMQGAGLPRKIIHNAGANQNGFKPIWCQCRYSVARFCKRWVAPLGSWRCVAALLCVCKVAIAVRQGTGKRGAQVGFRAGDWRELQMKMRIRKDEKKTKKQRTI